MADEPTLESLQQQVDEIRSLITTTYQPPSGIEYSYPIVGQPMNDEMWQYVTLGFGDGVFDEGGQPYWLRARENANNTLKITVSYTTQTAQALLRGFYHKMTADKTFTVPGVTKDTLYHFCLTYNPVGLKQSKGPISLQMYAGTPPTTQGRFHIILWTLLRKPNQLLTDAVVQRVRPKITPTLSVNDEADRPDPSQVLWGTRVLCHSSGVEYRAAGASDETGGPTRWERLGLTFGWVNLSLNSAYEAQGVTPAYRVIDGYIEFRGTVRRKNKAALSTGEYGGFCWVNERYRLPDFNGVGNATGGRQVAIVTGYGSDNIRNDLLVYARESGTTWFAIDGIRIPLA